MLIILHTIVH